MRVRKAVLGVTGGGGTTMAVWCCVPGLECVLMLVHLCFCTSHVRLPPSRFHTAGGSVRPDIFLVPKLFCNFFRLFILSCLVLILSPWQAAPSLRHPVDVRPFNCGLFCYSVYPSPIKSAKKNQMADK